MAVDITALYCCLDDFCKAFADWEAHRLIPSPTTRQRSGKLSRSEMLLIVVLFHLSPLKAPLIFYSRAKRVLNTGRVPMSSLYFAINGASLWAGMLGIRS